MKWHNPYYNELVAIISKKGDESSSEIKKLVGLDEIRIFLTGEPEDEILEYILLEAENENPQYMPLLHMAVTLNNQKVVKALLENGADHNILDKDGWTPLQVAVINDFQEVVRILLKSGADINAQNDQKNTALHLAIRDQSLDIVQILLENGANSSIKDQKGNTPLHIATNLSSDIKVYTKGIGKSSLLVATVTKQQISDYSNKETRETTQVIPINIKNLAEIKLSRAARGYSNNVKIIQALLSDDTSKESENALINQANYQGYCPIHLAVQNNNSDAAEVLLSDPRIDVNVRIGTSGETALMLAVRENNCDMIKLLLNHKDIDLNTEDFPGRTAFEYALGTKCSDDIIAVLWHNIKERSGNGALENHSIKLEQNSEIEERLDRLEKDYGINLRPMIEFTYSSYSESESEGYESDVNEESEVSENQILEHQETEAEMSETEVEEGPSAKRQRLG